MQVYLKQALSLISNDVINLHPDNKKCVLVIQRQSKKNRDADVKLQLQMMCSCCYERLKKNWCQIDEQSPDVVKRKLTNTIFISNENKAFNTALWGLFIWPNVGESSVPHNIIAASSSHLDSSHFYSIIWMHSYATSDFYWFFPQTCVLVLRVPLRMLALEFPLSCASLLKWSVYFLPTFCSISCCFLLSLGWQLCVWLFDKFFRWLSKSSNDWRVGGSISGQDLLCPWSRHFTVLSSSV